MTDQTIPAVTDDDRRRARECAEFIEADMSAWGDGIRALVRVFLNAFPAPPRPTLADMTPEERAACQWMQTDVKDRGVRYVIANPYDDDNEVALIDPDGDICWLPPGRVTPRPDLPRLEWPADKKAEDVPPTKAGTVIDSADDPRLAALPIDSILLDRDGDAVTKERKTWTGPGYIPIPREGDEFGPWKVIYIGREAADATD